MSKKKFHKDIEKISDYFLNLANSYQKSKTIQLFMFQRLVSFVVAQLISNFFDNLTQINIKEENLPKGFIKKIKDDNSNIIKISKQVIRNPLGKEILDFKVYDSFKNTLIQKYSEHSQLLEKLEEFIDFKSLVNNINAKEKKFRNSGKEQDVYTMDYLLSLLTEKYIEEKRNFPEQKIIDKVLKKFPSEIMPELSGIVYNSVMKSYRGFKKVNNKDLKGFLKRNRQLWADLFDHMNYYITLSEEIGEDIKHQLNEKNKFNYKGEAIIRIHARSLQISREILHLLEGGFADGATSRWRSLYELAIVALFLGHENDRISERFLNHEVLKAYKNAIDYKNHYKKLNHKPLGRKYLASIKKEAESLLKRYGKEYQFKNGFEWIPPKHLKKGKYGDRNFRALEYHVKMGHWHPYFNLASDTVHSGAKGFYRIGLWDQAQGKVLLTGRTDYGFEDPIQNTVIMLGIINSQLLSVFTDFKSVMMLNVLIKLQQKIKMLIITDK